MLSTVLEHDARLAALEMDAVDSKPEPLLEAATDGDERQHAWP